MHISLAQLVTRGIACYTNQCKTRMHTHCFNNFKRRHHQCPSCSQSWAEANLTKLRPVGEAAYREGQDLNQRRARRKYTGDDDDDDEEDEEERDYENGDDAEPEPSQSQPAATQKKGKGKRKAAREESEDEAEEQEESPPPQTQRRRSSRR